MPTRTIVPWILTSWKLPGHAAATLAPGPHPGAPVVSVHHVSRTRVHSSRHPHKHWYLLSSPMHFSRHPQQHVVKGFEVRRHGSLRQGALCTSQDFPHSPHWRCL